MKTVGIVSHLRAADGIIYNQVSDQLVQALERNGLIPLIIPITDYPMLEDYLRVIDGLIIAGNTSVAPFVYGEEPDSLSGALNLEHDQFELTMIKLATGHVPILGLERGAQLINVAFGGSLNLIDSKVIHHGLDKTYHSVTTRKRSIMSDLYGPRLIVSSNHTHRIGDLGNDLKVSGKSSDGVIEVIEHQSLPIIGLQFPAQELPEPLSDLLFQAFRQIK